MASAAASRRLSHLRSQLRALPSPAGGDSAFEVALQSRADGAEPTTRTERWRPAETALIICDMWNLHPCLNATRRGAELCPTMDRLIGRMRGAGATIVHAPSGCMGQYEGTPARRRAQEARHGLLAEGRAVQ